MKTLTLTLATLVALVALPAMCSQSQNRDEDRFVAAQQMQEESVIGCLYESSEGDYILTSLEGQRILVTGSRDLAKHVGHTVRVTGEVSKREEEIIFEVSQVELIAEECGR